MQEIGTLAELDVKPGDVVELVSRQIPGDGWAYPEIGDQRTISVDDGWHGVDLKYIGELQGTFRIVSRATPAEPASEIVWGPWGEFEAGRFPVQTHSDGPDATWLYRYPVPKQPVVETVTLSGGYFGAYGWRFENGISGWNVTYCITFETKDGEPDWSTLRGEDLS